MSVLAVIVASLRGRWLLPGPNVARAANQKGIEEELPSEGGVFSLRDVCVSFLRDRCLFPHFAVSHELPKRFLGDPEIDFALAKPNCLDCTNPFRSSRSRFAGCVLHADAPRQAGPYDGSSLSRYAALFLLAFLHHFAQRLSCQLDVDFAGAESKGLNGPDLLRLRFCFSSGCHRRLPIHDTAIASAVISARSRQAFDQTTGRFRLPRRSIVRPVAHAIVSLASCRPTLPASISGALHVPYARR